ncbi:Helix-turn-helix domain protein [compost metagenome]
MDTNQSGEIAAITSEIAKHLGYDPDKKSPLHINDEEAAAVLGVKKSTLSVWRSTGRYDLKFIKVGRLVRYRISDLAEFLARRSANHTGKYT